jgi:AraC-like DNA-binding protein
MGLIRFSTAHLPAARGAALFQDEVGHRLIKAETRVDRTGPRPFHFEMSMAFGVTLRMIEARMAAIEVARRPRDVRDGDDDISCFLPSGVPVRTDHNGVRGVIRPGGALLVRHGRAGASSWPDNLVTLLMLPRSAFADPAAIDAASGRVHDRGRPVLKLLRAYLRSVWRDAAAAGPIPPDAERNVAAMIQALAATTPEGMRRAAWPALGPARVAAMREVIARRATEPGLGMREVAAAVGLSERSGHLVLAAAGLTFGACLAEARLERVRARLMTGQPGRIIDIAFDAGFGDVAHFNRLFRRRFAMTPTEMLHGRARPGR